MNVSSPILIAKSYHERAKGKLTPKAPQNSLVLRRLQKQECDKDRHRTAVGSKYQPVGMETAKVHGT